MSILSKLKAVYAFLILVVVFVSCSKQQALTGYYSGSLQFSEYEKLEARLWLDEDSSFVYISQANMDEDWFFFAGKWQLIEGKLFLNSVDAHQLWLHPSKNRLEVLDFSGNTVIGEKHFVLHKSLEIPNETVNISLPGELTFDAEGYKFRPCAGNANYHIALEAEDLQPLELENLGQGLDKVFVDLRVEAIFPESLVAAQKPLQLLEVCGLAAPCEE